MDPGQTAGKALSLETKRGPPGQTPRDVPLVSEELHVSKRYPSTSRDGGTK